MTRLVTVSWGSDQFRFGPWHADGDVAYVAVSPRVSQPTSGGVRLLLDRLASQGFHRVVTAAQRPEEAAAFTAAGFDERERLVVLSHDLRSVPSAVDALPTGTSSRTSIRRARRADRPAVLALDARAFEAAWRLDDHGLVEALDATPHTRFRVIEDDGVIGYAICGRAARTGYIQRLAVDPTRQHAGLGRWLIVDALTWLRRRSATLAMVNTQQSNLRALDLYRRLGFRTEPVELAVMTRDLAR
jgi:ribosomal-protein-alanine N-acetyltransferase